MLFKAVIITLLILIMLSLGMGLWYIWVDRNHSNRAVRSLTWRVGLSAILLVLLALGVGMQWIRPQGMPAVQSLSTPVAPAATRDN